MTSSTLNLHLSIRDRGTENDLGNRESASGAYRVTGTAPRDPQKPPAKLHNLSAHIPKEGTSYPRPVLVQKGPIWGAPTPP